MTDPLAVRGVSQRFGDRVVLDDVDLDVAIGVATVVVVARMSAVVYRRAIVRTGRRLKLRDALRPVPR